MKVRLTGEAWGDLKSLGTEPLRETLFEVERTFAGGGWVIRDLFGEEWWVDDDPESEWAGEIVDEASLVVSGPRHYTSDASLREMLDTGVLTKGLEVAVREELRLRQQPPLQDVIDDFWERDLLVEDDEWDAADKLHEIRRLLDEYDTKKETRQ